MAMDKEALLRYFLDNYLSQNEVLARLPVNISFDSFWKELTLRRRSGAVTLPLLNSSGEPYWFHITEPMIRISERISSEAMKIRDSVDPYTAGMTTAMTEEMFYTSYVEGASIEYDDAMACLCEDREPADTLELMLWNNRQAWEEVVGRLWLPLDEERIRLLASILTKDMQDQADEYRMNDDHIIAAIGTEDHRLPTAEQIPARMKELCEYISNSSVHPLLKAAVAQAYILAVRPFDDGNERLARLLSTAVLLRSGYDFFRDISISDMIARESFRYYSAMKEIHREDNAGDLTCFVNYYFGLLDRVLDLREDRARRHAENELKKQRELALLPLEQAAADATGITDLESSDSGEDVITTENTDQIIRNADPSKVSGTDGDQHTQDEVFHLNTENEPDDCCKDVTIKNKLVEHFQQKYNVAMTVETSSQVSCTGGALNMLAQMHMGGKDRYSSRECMSLAHISCSSFFRYARILIRLGAVFTRQVDLKSNAYCLTDDPIADAIISERLIKEDYTEEHALNEPTVQSNELTVQLNEPAVQLNESTAERIYAILYRKYADSKKLDISPNQCRYIPSALRMLAEMYITQLPSYNSFTCQQLIDRSISRINENFQILRAMGAIDFSISKRNLFTYYLREDAEINSILQSDGYPCVRSKKPTDWEKEDIGQTKLAVCTIKSDYVRLLLDTDLRFGGGGFRLDDLYRPGISSKRLWGRYLAILSNRGILRREKDPHSGHKYIYFLEEHAREMLSNAIEIISDNTPVSIPLSAVG